MTVPSAVQRLLAIVVFPPPLCRAVEKKQSAADGKAQRTFPTTI